MPDDLSNQPIPTPVGNESAVNAATPKAESAGAQLATRRENGAQTLQGQGAELAGQTENAAPLEQGNPVQEAHYELDVKSLLEENGALPALQADPALEQEFKDLAASLGLKQEQVSGLAELYARSLARQLENLGAEHSDRARQTEEDWIAELKADRNFPVQVSRARSAVKAYGEPALIDMLEDTRLGSHPALVRFMARVGEQLAEPGFRSAKASQESRSPAEVLYPDQYRR